MSSIKTEYEEPQKECTEPHQKCSGSIVSTNCFESTSSVHPRISSSGSKQAKQTDQNPVTNESDSGGQVLLPFGIAAAILGLILLTASGILSKKG